MPEKLLRKWDCFILFCKSLREHYGKNICGAVPCRCFNNRILCLQGQEQILALSISNPFTYGDGLRGRADFCRSMESACMGY